MGTIQDNDDGVMQKLLVTFGSSAEVGHNEHGLLVIMMPCRNCGELLKPVSEFLLLYLFPSPLKSSAARL